MHSAVAQQALEQGTGTALGAIPRASNDTPLVGVDHPGTHLKAVYKPASGDRPLADFPLHTLSLREVASYRLSAHLDLNAVPPTVLRSDLGAGPGSLQAYVEDSGDDDAVTLTAVDAIPAAHTPMFALRTEDGTDLVLSHDARDGLRAIAFFDLLANNADRKAGHIITGSYLPGCGPSSIGTFGIDNGLTFHAEEKVRTILWGFSHSSFRVEEVDALDEVARMSADLRSALEDCLEDAEIDSLRQRAERLGEVGTFPEPPVNRTVIPWPPI
ncbi:MAG: SCO1664 family protein [Brevibacterium sp.]|nr:SCO1664 family protein [Brevibacterium sp.]